MLVTDRERVSDTTVPSARLLYTTVRRKRDRYFFLSHSYNPQWAGLAFFFTSMFFFFFYLIEKPNPWWGFPPILWGGWRALEESGWKMETGIYLNSQASYWWGDGNLPSSTVLHCGHWPGLVTLGRFWIYGIHALSQTETIKSDYSKEDRAKWLQVNMCACI